jgi:hypothetical protein
MFVALILFVVFLFSAAADCKSADKRIGIKNPDPTSVMLQP